MVGVRSRLLSWVGFTVLVGVDCKSGKLLSSLREGQTKDELCSFAELNQVLDRNVEDLSGGELQRFAIGVVAAQKADVYMFDEPSSYLDVKQRLKAAQVVRSLLHPERCVCFHFITFWSSVPSRRHVQRVSIAEETTALSVNADCTLFVKYHNG